MEKGVRKWNVMLGKIRTYRWVIILSILSLTIMLFSCFMLRQVYDEYIEQSMKVEENQLLAVSKSVASNLETYVDAYGQDLIYMVGSDNFREAETAYWESGDTKNLIRQMYQYLLSRKGQIASIFVKDDINNVRFGTDTKNTYEWLKEPEDTDNPIEIWQCKNQQNQLFLALTVQQKDGLDYTLLLSVRSMYDDIVSNVKLDDNGYVTIMNSDGVTLMHYLVREIGHNMIEQKKELHPELDVSELEDVTKEQLTGAEGIRIYKSFQWSHKPPTPITNISAFAPVNISNDFLVVNSIMNFEKLQKPFITSTHRFIFFIFCFMTALLCIFVMILRFAYANTKMAEENLLLKERNTTLEEINEREELMMHKQRLQTIGTLASGIVHEFNNLLTPIMGYSALILQEMNPKNELYEDIQNIYAYSEKAKEIVCQISRLSRKNVESTFDFIDFNFIIKDALNVVLSGKPENIQLVTTLNCRKATIKGNVTQLYQVVTNLCFNSFHAMKENGGILTLSTELIEDWLFFRIEDTGYGIPADIIGHIFDPFFTTKVASEGTGLGLAIVQSVIESHCGEISVASEANVGTIFTIKLPVKGNI